MKKLSPLFFAVLSFYSCQSKQSDIPEQVSEESILIENIDTIETIHNSFDDSLTTYFESPLDFYALKKKTLHMLDGGSKDLNESYFHPKTDPNAILYTYMCLEHLQTDNKSGRNLQFATWKPWSTSKQKYYETDNEILIGIRCKINWSGLERSNFVGTHIDSVKARFGEPHAKDDSKYIGNTTSIYFQKDKILLLNEDDKKVKWFKYYWWHEEIVSIDLLPEEIFEWND